MIPFKILTSEGFNERFEENMAKYSLPQSKVYDITEREHEQLTGRTHYSGFKSFHNTRSRKLKR